MRQKKAIALSIIILFVISVASTPTALAFSLQITNKGDISDYPTAAYWALNVHEVTVILTVRWTQDFQGSVDIVVHINWRGLELGFKGMTGGGGPGSHSVTLGVEIGQHPSGAGPVETLTCQIFVTSTSDQGTGFLVSDSYTWSLTATDRGQPCQPPNLSLSTPEVSGLTVKVSGYVGAGCSDATVTRLHWDWGDGQSEDSWFPASHTYGGGDTYTITVTAYQSDGLSTTKPVTVTLPGGGLERLEITYVEYPRSVRTGESFTVDVTVRYVLNGPRDVAVDLYQNAGPLLSSKRRTLSGDGSEIYDLVLTAPSMATRWQLNIHLQGEFKQSIYIDVGQPCQPPNLSLSTPEVSGLTVKVSGYVGAGCSDATVTRLHWDWGDGQSEDSWFPASHTYGGGDTYTITVTAYQSDGQSTTKTVTVSQQPPTKVKVYVYAIDDSNRQHSYNIQNVVKIAGAQIRVEYSGFSQVLTTGSSYPGPYVEVDENSQVTVAFVQNPSGWTFAGHWNIFQISWSDGNSRTFNVGTSDKHVSASFEKSAPQQASLSVSVSPNPVTIQSGGNAGVSYVFTETNGVGVHVTSRDWVWVLSDGSRVSPGSGSNDVNVGPRGSAKWVDNPYLSPDIAQRSQQLGSNSVVLATTFHGTDSNGNTVNAQEVRLTIQFTVSPAERLEVSDVHYPSSVKVGEVFNVDVDVTFSLPSPKTVTVDIYENAGPLLRSSSAALSGSGTKTFALSITAPQTPRNGWQLNVHLQGEYKRSIYIDVAQQPLTKVRVYVYGIMDSNRQNAYDIQNVGKIAGAQIRVSYPGSSQILTTGSDYPGPFVEVVQNTEVTVEFVQNPTGWTFAGHWNIFQISWSDGDSRTFNVGTSDKHVSASFSPLITTGITVIVELDDSFTGSSGGYYISSVRATCIDQTSFDFLFSSQTIDRLTSVELPGDSSNYEKRLVPTDRALQPIVFQVGVSSEDLGLKSLDIAFNVDLSDFTEKSLTISLGKTGDGTLYVSSVDPPLDLVHGDTSRNLAISAVTVHQDPYSQMMNRVNPLCLLFHVTCMARTYYYDVVISNPTEYTIALMGVFIGPKSSLIARNWVADRYKVLSAPEHGGLVSQTWRHLSIITEAGQVYDTYAQGGMDPAASRVITDSVQDFTHTQNTNSVDLLMADPTITYQGKTSFLILMPGDQPATIEFEVKETAYGMGQEFTPSFYAQFVGVAEVVKIPGHVWDALANWANFLVGAEFWTKVNTDDIALVPPAQGVVVPSIPL